MLLGVGDGFGELGRILRPDHLDVLLEAEHELKFTLGGGKRND